MTYRGRSWTVMLAAFVAGVAVTINQFKVPPVLPALTAELHVGLVTGGWLMSVFSVAAILLSIPAAFLLNRLGPRLVGVVALACVVVGSSLGALATSAAAMLASRVVEGISVGLIAIVAPTVISQWFEPGERGLPMGIWAAWVPVGNVIMFNLANPLAAGLGWRSIWWFGALVGLGALLLFGLVAAAPPRRRAGSGPDPVTPSTAAPSTAAPGTAGRFLTRPLTWLLPLIFGTFTFALIGYNTWAPTFLTTTLSIGAATASFYASLMFLAAIGSNVAAGWVLNHVRQRRALLTVAMLATGVLYLWCFRLGSVALVVPYMLVLGLVSNFVPTAAFTLAPETATGPAFVGLALATLNVGSNLGVLLGPPLLGAIAGGGNWAWGSAALMAVSAVGVAASLLFWKKEEK